MNAPGPRNLITDVAGLKIGNAGDATLRSGVTVVLCEQPTITAAVIPGGAPGSRETDLLRPDCLVEKIDALVFSGGSSFGLDAAGAITAELAQQGRGFQVGPQQVPIVPGVILFDLLNGGNKNWGTEPPYRKLGRQALAAADYSFRLGNTGAGLGATAGPLKGGLGSASWVLADGFTVGALVAVNAFGSAVMPDSPLFWSWPFEYAAELGDQRRLLNHAQTVTPDDDFQSAMAAGNTTLGLVATDALLSKTQARRLALMAQAGLARALRPVYTPFDGDSVFALATGAVRTKPVDAQMLSRLGYCAADCLSRAVARGVYEAASLPGWQSYCDVYRDYFPSKQGDSDDV